MSGRTYLEIGGKQIKKIYLKTANGEVELKKGYSYPGNRNVFSSGHIVVYHIDTNNAVNKEVDDGADCIANAPSAEKSGWTFHGWREDSIASADVIQSRTCDSDDIHLYAVFKQTITLSYNGNSATSGSTANQTADRYYNNGNSTNASFTLRANGYTRTNYSFAKWAQGSTSGTKYSPGATVALSANTTFYAYWVATVTSYGYTGGMQSFTAPVAGTYKLEVWGAEGGSYMAAGGKGGYSYGNKVLSAGQIVYIGVGGKGATFNGGGIGSANGGGGTHIGLSNTQIASTSISNLLIVAGGGGGGGSDHTWSPGSGPGGQDWYGGDGGGTNGGNGSSFTYGDYGQDVYYSGFGASQSGGGRSGYLIQWGSDILESGGTSGSYGQGGRSTIINGTYYGGAGGGGYYGGGGAGYLNAIQGGGGGSGYIGGVSSPKSTSNGQRSGDGYARVTFVSAS